MAMQKCPKCGRPLTPSPKDSAFLLCYYCKKKFKVRSASKPIEDELKIDEPEIEVPEISEPEIEVPEVEAPEVGEPEVEAPEVDEPEADEPEIEMPEVDEPEIDEPEIDDSEVDEPENMIICPYCDMPNESSSLFCAYCGQKVSKEEPFENEHEDFSIHENETAESPILDEPAPESVIEEKEPAPSPLPENGSTPSDPAIASVDFDATKEGYKNLSKVLFIITIVFILIGLAMMGIGFHKILVYYSSEYVPSLNKNAYVGGDAYNYIINGTYFTAYSILGMGSWIIATITGITSSILKIKSK